VVTAIIVAAGMGRRMESAVAKQFLPLAGVPLVTYSLQVFQEHEQVDRMVLVLPPRTPPDLLDTANYSKLTATVQGGNSRQASVAQGLAAAKDSTWVLIHDAARPLVSPALVASVLEAARASGAAVPACRIGDTIKRAEGELVGSTLEREGLLAVQTPQAFRTDLAQEAHEAARRDGFVGTDDAQLVERLGHRVVWVEGSPINLKVTTADDLKLAAALLQGRGD
jgi:2-C-methyl-D-erythritol 4-phosphate cytidylyltransferase